MVHPIINGGILQDNFIEVYPPSLLTDSFDMVVQLRWPTLSTGPPIYSYNTTVDSSDDNSTMSLYANCTFTFLNVALRIHTKVRRRDADNPQHLKCTNDQPTR